MRLVADIGGTNSRLALSQAGLILPDTQISYTNENWPSLYAVINEYLSGHEPNLIQEMVIAVAGPVAGNHAKLTNLDWAINTEILGQATCCPKVFLLNDLTALGYSVPRLDPSQLSLINAGDPIQRELRQSLVVGVGTGFNVSPVLQTQSTVVCSRAEAGHISMPSVVLLGLSEVGIGPTLFPTIEHLFSGRGFTAFCQTVTGQGTLTGRGAIQSYGQPNEPQITRAIDQYATLLGALLKDMYLAYMPASGIYIAGSVGRAITRVSPENCIKALQAPCGIKKDAKVSVWTIEDDAAALLGCANFSV